MKYQPITCVWEITMGCNMRCGHCGSSCEKPLDDQLDTDEALDLCNQISDLGLRWITISGGEPLTREDLPQIVKRLTEQGVSVNIITNGWLMDPAMADSLKESGISTVAISIDGTQEIHDNIRKAGAFEHASNAFHALNQRGIQTGAVTTITKQNINILNELKTALIDMGVKSWQVQIGLPMGNLKEKPDWLIEPYQVNDIIDFCYNTAKEGKIKVYPADCIGYYTQKDFATKQISYETNNPPLWDGCNAGIRGFGILQNGDILGCTSIRNEEYIEGNIRNRPLKDIWEDKESFLWRREMTKNQLSDSCKNCQYGSKCLGGCPNTRLTMNGDIYSENQYCAYNLELKQLEEKYKDETEEQGLFALAQNLMEENSFQESSYILKQIIILNPQNAKAMTAKGYCEYMCGNYENCKEDNKMALELNDNDAYALRGYAIALHRLGQTQEALIHMNKAVQLTNGANLDFIEDLRILESAK